MPHKEVPDFERVYVYGTLLERYRLHRLNMHPYTRYLTLYDRRTLKKAASFKGNIGVVIVDGDTPPGVEGERGHWLTRDGKRVDSPKEQGQLGWRNMSYVPSTMRFSIGIDWLRENRKKLFVKLTERALANAK